MRRQVLHRFAVALALVALAAPAVIAQPEVTHEPRYRGMQADTLAFWTRERIATAPALPMPVDPGSPRIVASVSDHPASPGRPESSAAGRPEPGSNAFHRAAYPADWQHFDEDWGALYRDDAELEAPADLMAGTSQVFTFYGVNVKTTLWKIYPHRWMGKFTFNTPTGSGSCSATAISKNHVVTAAHCVFDTGPNKWFTNKAFTPAYRNGNAPYGVFPTWGCVILTAWKNLSGSYSINSWARYDVAVCNVGKNSAGKTLNQAVGWAGRSWNYGYKQLHFNSGYPARFFNDNLIPGGAAQYLRSCTAESFKQTTDTVGGGCQFGRGISGGSWLRNYKANYVSGNVNSVNSGLYIGTKNLYGPRFTSNNIVPLCNATNC